MTVKFETTRPLDALDSVGIAELAVFTPLNGADTAQEVDRILREEWSFEVDRDHPLEYLDFREGRIMFRDGSGVTFKAKEFRG